MKLLIALTGLGAGLFVGLGALLFNPLSPAPTLPGSGSITYQLAPLEFHGAELDHIALLGLPGQPAGEQFAADNIATANAAIMVLSTPGGDAMALVTRLTAADRHSDLLRGDVGSETYTNMFFPNRGSLFMSGRENRWPIVRSGTLRSLGQPGELLWPVTTRVQNGDPSGVVGGSGQLEYTGGRYTESLQLSPAGNGTFNSEIVLELVSR